MANVRQRMIRACRIDGSGFYRGMLHEGFTEESSDKLLKVGKPGEELPDGVYAVERVVSRRAIVTARLSDVRGSYFFFVEYQH